MAGSKKSKDGFMNKMTSKLDNPNNTNSATFWKRAIAFIFDLLLINLVIAWPFQSALQKYALKELTFESVLPTEAYFIVMMIFMLALLYFTFLEYYIGQTPGQMLMGIESIANNGEMTFWKALGRNIFILPFFPFYVLWILEPIYLIFYKQRLLERWTNTNTVIVGKNSRENNYEKFNLKKVE